MNGSVLVGIDVGTSAVKATVVDEAGHELAEASHPSHWTDVPTGAETSLADLRQRAVAAAHDALEQVPEARVGAVGITGMAEAGTLLDAHDEPVGPVIAWHDSRGHEHARRLADDVGGETFAEVTGLPISATPTLTKLAWLRDNADYFAAARRWLGVPEAIAHSLGAAPSADLCLACRTGLLDLDARTWWGDALAWLGVPQLALGAVAPSGAALGRVRIDAGVPVRLHDAVLAVGGHDHLTAAVGAGALADDELLDSCGTAEALIGAAQPLTRVQRRSAVADGLSVSWHVLPDRHAVIAARATGAFLTVVLELLGRAEPRARAALDQAAARSLDSGGLHFTESTGTAVLSGIRAGCRPEHVWRAAVECSTEQAAALLKVLAEHGVAATRIVTTGGWSHSDCLMSTKRARLGHLAVPDVQQAGARGAALMAGVAAGLYPTPYDVPRPEKEGSQ